MDAFFFLKIDINFILTQTLKHFNMEIIINCTIILNALFILKFKLMNYFTVGKINVLVEQLIWQMGWKWSKSGWQERSRIADLIEMRYGAQYAIIKQQLSSLRFFVFLYDCSTLIRETEGWLMFVYDKSLVYLGFHLFSCWPHKFMNLPV